MPFHVLMMCHFKKLLTYMLTHLTGHHALGGLTKSIAVHQLTLSVIKPMLRLVTIVTAENVGLYFSIDEGISEWNGVEWKAVHEWLSIDLWTLYTGSDTVT